VPDVRSPGDAAQPRRPEPTAVAAHTPRAVAAPVLGEPDWLKALRMVAFWGEFCEGKWRPYQTAEQQ
jgi:hypothetical protein